MKNVPYGSALPPKDIHDVTALRKIVRVQSEQMQVAQRDISELKDLARRLNTKYETEQKRMRQFQEAIVLANAQARNLVFQNEDMRERLQHIEAFGVEQRHVHTVRYKAPPEGAAVAYVGILAIIGMFLMLLYTVATTLG